MKKIAIIFISLLLITGCGSKEAKVQKQMDVPLTPAFKESENLASEESTSEATTIEPTTTDITTTTSTSTTTSTKKTTVATTKKTTKKITTTKKTTKKTTTTKKKTTTTKKTTTKQAITAPVGLTEKKAHEILLSLKKEYPEGKTWNDNTWSDFHGGNYSGGWGCVGFTYMASDRVFGNLPVRRITDFSKIRVGDIFRYQNASYGHSVIVLEVKSDRIVVVEGNWQKKVHWNREITFDYMKKYGRYIYTRWPK